MGTTFQGSLKAQSIISGDIAGVVTDQSGAAVPKPLSP